MGKTGIISGLVLATVFFIMIGYLVFMNDPIIVTIIDTGTPRTEMSITNHTRTGELDYWYHVIDGVGNIQP